MAKLVEFQKVGDEPIWINPDFVRTLEPSNSQPGYHVTTVGFEGHTVFVFGKIDEVASKLNVP